MRQNCKTWICSVWKKRKLQSFYQCPDLMSRPCNTTQPLSPSAPHLSITIQWLVTEMHWTLKAPALSKPDAVQPVCFIRILSPLAGHSKCLECVITVSDWQLTWWFSFPISGAAAECRVASDSLVQAVGRSLLASGSMFKRKAWMKYFTKL